MKALQKKHLATLRIGSLLMLYTGLTAREKKLARELLQEYGFEWREAEKIFPKMGFRRLKSLPSRAPTSGTR